MVCFAKKHFLPLVAVAIAVSITTLHAHAADITVGSPVNGTRIASPIMIRAHNVGCEGAKPTSFNYSIDDSKTLYRGETPYDIDVTNHEISPGKHTIHFKSATSKGECSEVSTTFNVTSSSNGRHPSSPPMPSPPAIWKLPITGYRWTTTARLGTPTATTSYPATTPAGDDARLFSMDYWGKAGERWSNTFAKDTKSTHFVFDVYVLLPDPSQIQNLELDINQVAANGDTILMTTQCSSNSKKWEYGDVDGDTDHWLVSNIPCDTEKWSANVWHHIQIGEHHDGSGVLTHDYVIFDGVYTPFVGATHRSAKNEGWRKGDINTQFQIEGSQ